MGHHSGTVFFGVESDYVSRDMESQDSLSGILVWGLPLSTKTPSRFECIVKADLKRFYGPPSNFFP